jgi:hypothetical protein
MVRQDSELEFVEFVEAVVRLASQRHFGDRVPHIAASFESLVQHGPIATLVSATASGRYPVRAAAPGKLTKLDEPPVSPEQLASLKQLFLQTTGVHCDRGYMHTSDFVRILRMGRVIGTSCSSMRAIDAFVEAARPRMVGWADWDGTGDFDTFLRALCAIERHLPAPAMVAADTSAAFGSATAARRLHRSAGRPSTGLEGGAAKSNVLVPSEVHEVIGHSFIGQLLTRFGFGR